MLRGLVVFDLDGTLLRGSTVCEVLAAGLGRSAEMKRIEGYRSDEEIVAGREEMALWYRGVVPLELQTYLANATLAPGAREAIQSLRQAHVLTGIASYTWSFAVEWFAKQLEIPLFLGTRLSSDGVISHVWHSDKVTWLHHLTEQYGLSRGRTAAVGDTVSDVPMLEAVALPFFVGSVVPKGAERFIHLPAADLRVVANRILGTWAVAPNDGMSA